ncbi:MAG TPA: ECF-type sigma factor, partial [Rudaea sp.]|nr:ECF-type sigma factor [Rudaea sp.]
MRDVEALTGLLNAAQSGDADAARSAYELVYAELKRRARNSLRSARPDDTLTPTALVHEVYLRFHDSAAQPLRDRSHFYALAARAMRQILVDHARRRCAD